jgi:hypothetical protein
MHLPLEMCSTVLKREGDRKRLVVQHAITPAEWR